MIDLRTEVTKGPDMFRLRGVVVAIALTFSVGALTPLAHAVASGPTTPPAREGMGMAYDAARSEVVLFGGIDSTGTTLGDTWTWDATTWTQEHPATSPPARYAMGMTYDAARGDVVLFGGYSLYFGDTWTWDGTTWTHRHPAKSPPARDYLGMTYDAARSEVVLFGGYHSGRLGDTWTWDGSTWTPRHPATSPSARDSMGMAFDAARGDVVLFGGHASGTCCNQADTWTWDGTTWTQQHPATSPPGRGLIGMTYDADHSGVVVFGGRSHTHDFDDTWTWDGTTWTQQHSATSPSDRESMGMTYDAARGEVVVFGGENLDRSYFADTWTWDGTTWRVPFVAHLHLSPDSGPPGTVVQVTGTGFAAFESVTLTFVDPVAGKSGLGTFATDATGAFAAQVTVPSNSSVGARKITAVGAVSGQKTKATFTVT